MTVVLGVNFRYKITFTYFSARCEISAGRARWDCCKSFITQGKVEGSNYAGSGKASHFQHKFET